MKLYLVRHGEALPAEIDPNQGLSERGRREVDEVAQRLGTLEVTQILHSVKMRAKETAEIIAAVVEPKLELTEREGLKPLDAIEPLIEELSHLEENTMIVGHLPFLANLLSQLVLGEQREPFIDLCGGCVVCLDREGDQWHIAWILSPKQLL